MRVRNYLICLLLCLVLSLQLVGCGGSSGGAGTQEIATVRNAIISAHGEEGGFDALMAALSKGYTLKQIVDASLSGRLKLDGDISDVSGGTLAPEETATGSIVGKDLQIQIESRFVLLNDSFLEDIGVDFGVGLNAIDVPLELRETGHSVAQIFDGIDGGAIRFNESLSAFGIVDDSFEFLLNSLMRQNVLGLLALSNVPTPNTEVGNESGNQDNNDSVSENDILIQVSPTVIEAQHIVGQTQLPQRFGNFVVSNLGQETMQVEIGQANSALTLSENGTFLLNGLESKTVDVDFNGQTQLPFVSEIPVIGRLFRNSTPSQTKRTLMIFVTAQIIQPNEQ